MGLGKLIVGAISLASGMKALGEFFEEHRESAVGELGGRAGRLAGRRDPDMPKRTLREVHTLDQRIRYIVQMIRKGKIHPKVRMVVAKVLSRKVGGEWAVPEKNWKAEIIALFQAYRSRVRYVHDPARVDTYAHPKWTLKLGIGDCDDAAITLGSMLQAAGYPVKLRVVQTNDAPDWNHIYLLVDAKAGHGAPEWVPLDATMNKPPGWQVPRDRLKRVRDFRV